MQRQQIEQEIIIRLLQDNKLIPICYDELLLQDFQSKEAIYFYKQIIKAFEENRPINILTVEKRCKGGIRYITSDTYTITTREFEDLVKRLKEFSKKQNLEYILQDSIIGLKGSESFNSILSHAITNLSKLTTSQTTIIKPISDLISKHTQIMEKRRNNELTGITSGFSNLDRFLGGGFQRQDLILVGARPSVGKTSLALTFAYNAARQGSKVLFLSVEMRDQDILDRLLSFESGYSCTDIIRGDLTLEQLEPHYKTVAKSPISVVELSKATSHDVFSQASRYKQTNGLDLLVVDYLQYLSDSSNGESEAVRVGKISKNLKNTARLLDIPVICPTQLNRRSAKTKDEEGRNFTLEDLRDSGNLEQDADIVFLLNRAIMDNTNKTKAMLRVAKNRKGETGETNLNFDVRTTRFL